MKLKNCTFRGCNSNNVSLYAEDGYHDITCHDCGGRTGKYRDENKVIQLWNGSSTTSVEADAVKQSHKCLNCGGYHVRDMCLSVTTAPLN